MRLSDVFEIGETGSLPFVGLGLITLAGAYIVPSLRPSLGQVLKGSVKLFLEAELGADNALTDRLVDTSVDALMSITPQTADEERKRQVDNELDRFFRNARAGARRRGFDRSDARRRYHNHLSRMETALKSAQARAGPEHRQTLEHASRRVAHERLTRAGAGDDESRIRSTNASGDAATATDPDTRVSSPRRPK